MAESLPLELLESAQTEEEKLKVEAQLIEATDNSARDGDFEGTVDLDDAE